MMALGAMRAAHEAGRAVPNDLSIVGYDDVNLAAYTNPPLTTVAQPRHRMGSLAAEMLLARIADQTMPGRRTILNVRLEIRQSCAEPQQAS
jgi:LacI family transcriptional regulator